MPQKFILFPYLSWCIDGEERHDSGSYPMYVAWSYLVMYMKLRLLFPVQIYVASFTMFLLVVFYLLVYLEKLGKCTSVLLFILSYKHCRKLLDCMVQVHHVLDLHQFSGWNFWIVLDSLICFLSHDLPKIFSLSKPMSSSLNCIYYHYKNKFLPVT